VKVFISYSTEDGSTAASLFDDLHAAGAETFRFGVSETVGTPSWGEILSWIGASDVFVVLVSWSALGSVAVLEEVEHAHYSYINSNRTHPSKLVSALIQDGVSPPTVIARFSRIDLRDYGSGLGKLLDQLGLARSTVPPWALTETSSARSLIDFDEIRSGTTSPVPEQERKWSSDTAKVLANYELFKPPDLPEEKEAEHVDGILADLSGKRVSAFADLDSLADLNRAFLRRKPAWQRFSLLSGPESESDLPGFLLHFDPSSNLLQLPVPVLRATPGGLRWTPVLGATGYVLEVGFPSIDSWSEAYSGPETEYDEPAHALFRGYYRVKATGGSFAADSPWSATVRTGNPSLLNLGDLDLDT